MDTTRGKADGGRIGSARALFVCIALISSGLAAFPTTSSAQAGSSIAFLNPSSFADQGEGGVGIIVSDRQPSRPETGDGTYRLSAWVSNPPPTPAVEFELLRSGLSLLTIDQTDAVGNDTFEADWAIPDTLPDGMYTLRATLASNGIGIASVDQDVTISRLAERVEITNPVTRNTTSPSRFGTFLPLASGQTGEGSPGATAPIGNIDGLTTGESEGNGTSLVRAFYTTSSPGTEPEWIVCGTEAAPGDAFLSDDANDGVRCTLEESSHQNAITAVAMVANTAQNDYNRRLNQAGDATRVEESYAQVPTRFSTVGEEIVQAELGPDQEYGCQEIVAHLDDQYGREIAGANIDVNAIGPSDRLKFENGVFSEESGVKPPDRGGHAEEVAWTCLSGSDERANRQGEHQVVGGPDLKHVEADGSGTEDTGNWGFNIYIPAEEVSEARFVTQYVMWVDEANDGTSVNDDGCGTDELTAFGSIGWGGDPNVADVNFDLHCEQQAPPEPGPVCPGGPALPDGTCPSPPPSPGPTTSPEPEPEPTEPDAISLRVSDDRVQVGSRVRFMGRVTSEKKRCAARRVIRLASRPSPDNRFVIQRRKQAGDDGRWSFRRRMRSTSQWRVSAKPVPGCPRLLSRIVKVSVTRR